MNFWKDLNNTIPLEALFNQAGQLLFSKSQLAGTSLTPYQIQVLDTEELERALNSPLEVLAYNSNLQPGAIVPFMLLIMNPPAEATDFGIRIIEASRP